MNTTSGCMSSMPLGYEPGLRGPYIAAELLIAVTAIVGNFLVCLAVGQNRRLRTVTNYFLVSLSVADILVGLVAIPCAVLTDLGRPHHDPPLCLLLLSILMVLTQSSILSMLAVAVERYVAILRPFDYQRVMSPRNARLALLLTWVLSLITGSVPFMDMHPPSQDSTYCLFTCVVDMTYMVYFNFFGCLVLPLVVMFVIYAHIFYTVCHQLRRIAVARGTPEAVTRDPETSTTTRDPGTLRGPPAGRPAGYRAGGADAGGGSRRTAQSGGVGVEVEVSSRRNTLGAGLGRRVRVGGAAEGSTGVVQEEEEEEEEEGHPRLRAAARLDEAAAKNARSRVMDGGSRGGVSRTTPGFEARCEAGGAPEPSRGEPAGTGASRPTVQTRVRTKHLGPIIQTKTTRVFRKVSRRATGTLCSDSDDQPSGSTADSNRHGGARSRLDVHKATSLFLVLFMFMVCLMPIHLINCILLLRPQLPVPMPITLAAILLSHANSALNPLLYAYRMRSFRHTLKGMCFWGSAPKRH